MVHLKVPTLVVRINRLVEKEVKIDGPLVDLLIKPLLHDISALMPNLMQIVGVGSSLQIFDLLLHLELIGVYSICSLYKQMYFVKCIL